MKYWTRNAKALAESFLEVVQAELHSLLADFHRTGSGASKAGALLLLAALFTFWSLGLLITFLVALLATWVGFWQAAGLVFLVLAPVGAGIGYKGWKLLLKQKAPTLILRTHVDDHVGWWRRTLADRRSAAEAKLEALAEELDAVPEKPSPSGMDSEVIKAELENIESDLESLEGEETI